jgi:hypothetical protein
VARCNNFAFSKSQTAPGHPPSSLV